MKETVTKVIDMLTQEDFHGAFQKLLEWYNRCIAVGGDYFEGGLEFHVCTINISAHTKKSLETYLVILVYIHIDNSTRFEFSYNCIVYALYVSFIIETWIGNI